MEPNDFVGAQVIHGANIPKTQRRTQHALHIGPEDLGIRRALHCQDRLEALGSQRTQHGHILAIILRHAADDPCPARSAAIQSPHGQIDARFIYELQAACIQRGHKSPVGRPRLLEAGRVTLRSIE